MTETEARRILSETTLAGRDNAVVRIHVGNKVEEWEGAYAFCGWLYSDDSVADPEFAFEVFVDKASGKVQLSDAPIAGLITGETKPEAMGWRKEFA